MIASRYSPPLVVEVQKGEKMAPRGNTEQVHGRVEQQRSGPVKRGIRAKKAEQPPYSRIRIECVRTGLDGRTRVIGSVSLSFSWWEINYRALVEKLLYSFDIDPDSPILEEVLVRVMEIERQLISSIPDQTLLKNLKIKLNQSARVERQNRKTAKSRKKLKESRREST